VKYHAVTVQDRGVPLVGGSLSLHRVGVLYPYLDTMEITGEWIFTKNPLISGFRGIFLHNGNDYQFAIMKTKKNALGLSLATYPKCKKG